MRAILLFIELRFPLERCTHQLEALAAKLPQGSRRVMHAEKTIGIAIPWVDIPEVLAVRFRPVLTPFENWRFIPMYGAPACRNGNFDTLQDWVAQNVGVGNVRQVEKPEHMTLSQRRQPRR